MQVQYKIGCFPGFYNLLCVLIIIFKLAGIGVVAHWSWLWVLAPIWIPILLMLIIFVIFLLK